MAWSVLQKSESMQIAINSTHDLPEYVSQCIIIVETTIYNFFKDSILATQLKNKRVTIEYSHTEQRLLYTTY
jgi:hypothetical protein